jgi:hypothetical protein
MKKFLLVLSALILAFIVSTGSMMDMFDIKGTKEN